MKFRTHVTIPIELLMTAGAVDLLCGMLDAFLNDTQILSKRWTLTQVPSKEKAVQCNE